MEHLGDSVLGGGECFKAVKKFPGSKMLVIKDVGFELHLLRTFQVKSLSDNG